MPDGQFDIFIWGGSETVAGGRDFLRSQDTELNRAMNDFMQCCKEEKAAFEQSVNAMGNQCYNSAQLAEDAKNIADKAYQKVFQADQCLSIFNNFVPNAESMVYEAKSLLDAAECSISNYTAQLRSAKSDLERTESNISTQNNYIKNEQDNLKIYQRDLKEATDQLRIDTAKTNIEQTKSRIESMRNHPSYQGDLERASSLKNDIIRFKEDLAKAQSVKSAAETALAAAHSHLQLCRQKLSEAGTLKRRAEALEQKAKANQAGAEKAHHGDNEKYRQLKKTAKESARLLGELADNSMNIQRNASDNLCDNASIMDKLSGLMYDYETFSLDGGKS